MDSARIHRGTPRNLVFLARRLRAGELVAVPTETVYGLAADALNARACRKIFTAKRRPANDPLIVHIHSRRDLALVAETNPAAERLADKFWPGPLTLVLPKREAVPGVVTAGRPSVAVRMPAHPLFRLLLKLTGCPLAAPSANPFGYVSPTTAEHVRDGLGGRIKHILDGGPASIGLESTIVDVRDPLKPRLLRPGAITRKQLERALGVPVRVQSRAMTPLAPGQFASHYSPHTPVVLHERLVADRASISEVARASARVHWKTRAKARATPERKDAWLFIKKPAEARGPNIFWLDDRGHLAGAARRLFATLRRIDGDGFRKIHVELARGDGLADAINDRLQRAAAKK